MTEKCKVSVLCLIYVELRKEPKATNDAKSSPMTQHNWNMLNIKVTVELCEYASKKHVNLLTLLNVI